MGRIALMDTLSSLIWFGAESIGLFDMFLL
jgi:hypothetical protein